MGSAFDAELDKLHAAADEAFGVQAVFRAPNAQPVNCWVEKLAPETEFGEPGARVTAPAMVFMVRVAALPRKPVKDDVFEETAGGARWRVLASPTIDDDDGRRYTVKVERCK